VFGASNGRPTDPSIAMTPAAGALVLVFAGDWGRVTVSIRANGEKTTASQHAVKLTLSPYWRPRHRSSPAVPLRHRRRRRPGFGCTRCSAGRPPYLPAGAKPAANSETSLSTPYCGPGRNAARAGNNVRQPAATPYVGQQQPISPRTRRRRASSGQRRTSVLRPKNPPLAANHRW